MSAAVCARCGLPFPTMSFTAPPTPYQPGIERAGTPQQAAHKSDLLLIVGFVALLLFVAGIGTIIVRKSQDGSSNLTMLSSGNGKLNGDMTGTAGIPSDQIESRLATMNARTGKELDISLAWNSRSDIDIQVGEPGGELVSAHRCHSSRGGTQDVDANSTLVTPEGIRRDEAGELIGDENVIKVPDDMADDFYRLTDGLPATGDRPSSMHSRTPVEHVYYDHAPKGVYTVYASCYSWSEPDQTPLPITVLIRWNGKVFKQVNTVIGPDSFVSSKAPPIMVCKFEVK